MDITILNGLLNPLAIVDTYTSFIWTDRFNSHGDFEITIPASENWFRVFRIGNYITCEKSDHVMVIEKVQIKTDAESGSTLTISGRSVESLLDRRIIWGQRLFRGNLNKVFSDIFTICVGSDAAPERKIDVILYRSSNDGYIQGSSVELQCTGDNMYETLEKLAKTFEIGFVMRLEEWKFIFELYAGIDHSASQTVYPYVIFSPEYDNMIHANFMEDVSNLKTVALIGGEGEGPERKYAGFQTVYATGLDRREMFVDARDITTRVNNDTTIPLDEYNKLLARRGASKLVEKVHSMNFEGKVETTQLFVYGRDYKLGDIVQVENDFGNQQRARIVEVVMSYDNNGFSVYPTLQSV